MSNKNVLLVMGKPNMGKSRALEKLENQQGIVYLNTDNKELPFRHNFGGDVEVKDALHIHQFITQIETAPNVHMGVLDTLTFLMAMFERQHVLTSNDTQKAWGQYSQFYNNFIHNIKTGTKDYAILAHEATELNELTGQYESFVPVKGAVKRTGVEADFTTIVTCKTMPVAKLEGHENDLLNITDEDREDGIKRVFATRITKETGGDKSRSPGGLWERNELYIDNNIDAVFKRLKSYRN